MSTDPNTKPEGDAPVSDASDETATTQAAPEETAQAEGTGGTSEA